VDVRGRLQRARQRLTLPVLGRIAQTAAAAGIAWELALQIPNHGQPFFAPIAAVIALGADRGRRGRQAIDMMLGVTLGILLGAAIVALVGVGAWQIVAGTALSLLITTATGASPVIRIQSAASTILVVALHRSGQNLALQRLEDALVGGGIAILIARFLFPVDPLELVRDEARRLRRRLADGLDVIADALETGDRSRAREGKRLLDALDERKLEEALTLAREVTRAAPRRRRLRKRLEALGESWLELDASVSDARAIATGALRLLDNGHPAPQAAAAVRTAGDAVRAIEPDEARKKAEATRAAAAAVSKSDSSLGAGVITHAVSAVADHASRAAAAREEDSRLAEELRAHKRGLRAFRSRAG
jgi:Fusaric acid resistance protein-like